jgi:DNA polymerase-3 subunit epsilon
MASTLYAVIDIETTGGMPRRDRITEIAIVLYDGSKIIDRFESLINPERSIPWEITRITGITDDMVREAPKFYEVARKIVEMTEDAIFVAHNVRFDYGFIREEFATLGYTFTRRQLCTVVLSRKSFTGLRSYSLGNLITHFKIEVENRHRAMDDVMATVTILDRILSREDGVIRARRLISAGIMQTKIPAALSAETIQALPDITGVYYFYNQYGHVIYVGKSIHIKTRVTQHFANQDGKTDKFMARVSDVKFTATGSELIAMLLESSEIKALQPEINKAQRTKEYPYFVSVYRDAFGFIRFEWDKSSTKTRKEKEILNQYGSKAAARSHLLAACELFAICAGLSGIYEPSGGCFYYQTGACTGACQRLEEAASYNLRAEEAVTWLTRSFDSNFILVTEGREETEAAIVLVENGHYRGYGYINADQLETAVGDYSQYIEKTEPNPECNQIIRTWLEKYPETLLMQL